MLWIIIIKIMQMAFEFLIVIGTVFSKITVVKRFIQRGNT